MIHHPAGPDPRFDPEQWIYSGGELAQRELPATVADGIERNVRTFEVRMSFTFDPNPGVASALTEPENRYLYRRSRARGGRTVAVLEDHAHAAANVIREQLLNPRGGTASLLGGPAPGPINPFDAGTRASAAWVRRFGRLFGGATQPIERLVELWLGDGEKWPRGSIARVIEVSIADAT